MKKNWIALGILSAFAGGALADELSSNEKWLGGFIEYYSTDQEKSGFPNYYNDGKGFGAEFGFRFKPQWAARLEISHINLHSTAAGQDGSGNRYGVDALYFLPDDWIYIFGGIKRFTTEDGFNIFNVGVGKHWNLSEKWKVITEVAAYSDYDRGYDDIGVKLGLAYSFGGSSASAMSKDQDNDGVNDALDKCANTAAGAQVDAQGCAADDDNDGVLNHLDFCPNTPVGTPVDAKGCLVGADADKDGVTDSMDKCADTPATDKVDAMGCSVFIEKDVNAGITVQFAHNSSKVVVQDNTQFEQFAEFMRRYPNAQSTIEGHSSAPGEEQYNIWISQQRADAVRKVLIDGYNIDASRLTTKALGETQLIDEANTREANAKNRRVVAEVSAKEREKAQK